MLTVTKISPGAGYRYLTEQVASGRHDFRPAGDDRTAYYVDLDANGEAPGWWAGTGSHVFNVSGQVTEQQMQHLVGAGQHPVTGQQLGQVWRAYEPMTDEKRREAVEVALRELPVYATQEQRDRVWLSIMTAPDRQAVSAYDVTVSPVKSVSLLWAFGDRRVKAHVVAAHHAGVRTMLGHLERHGAFTRTGANGLCQVDVAGLAAMVFDHRMSREMDPQIHSHVVISAKVRTVGRSGAERWLALDGKALYQATIAARIAYERAVEVELARRLAVQFEARPGSTIREIVGISPAALGHYSKRRSAIETEMGHRTGGPDRDDSQVASRRWRRRAQDATLRTRRPKPLAESTRDAMRRWQVEDRQMGLGTADAVNSLVAGRVGSDLAQAGMRVLRRARAIAGRRRIEEDHPSPGGLH